MVTRDSTWPDTAARPTAAVAEDTNRDPGKVTWLDIAKRWLAKQSADYHTQQIANNVQAVATPFERVLQAIPAGGRGIAETVNQGLQGHNPLGWKSVDGEFHQPFVEGAADPRAGWRRTLNEHLPDFEVNVPPLPIGGRITPPLRFDRENVSTAAGLPLDIALDPMTYAGVGGLTEAGKSYRAAQMGKGAGELMLGGAKGFDEARAATERIHRAMDQLNELRPILEAEGTLPSRGRAALTFAGQTHPVLAQGQAVAAAQRVTQKVGATRVVRGLSHLMQPPERRIPEDLRGRWYAAAAAGGVGRREALRGLTELIDEYPDVLKAVGGDARAFDDALSLAHEKSMAPQFDNPIDHLTNDERAKFFEGDAAKRAQLEAVGRERARAALPSHLNRAENRALREAEAVIERNRALREQLAQPIDYTDQLGQKELSARERSELQRLIARRAKRENAFLGEVNQPEGVGIAGPVEPVPAVTPRVVDRTEQLSARVSRTKEQLQALEDEMYSRNERGLKLGDRAEQRTALQQKLAQHERALSRERQRLSELPAGSPGVPGAEAPSVGLPERQPPALLARPNDEARISALQDIAISRASKARAKSLAAAEKGASAAAARARALAVKAQSRADLQALRNSIGTARRMFFRGKSPEAARVFGDYAEKMVPMLNARNAAMFAATTREGVRLSELVDVQAYMLHATTPEAQKAMLEAAIERGEIHHGATFREWSEKHASQQTRKMRMTAVEANELARAGKLGITGGRKVDQFFYTNPLIAQVHREGAGAAAQGFARHLREAAVKYGRPVKTAPKGWRTVPNEVEGVGDQIAFEPEVADHLTRHHWALKDPWKVVEAYDRMNQIWKTYTLGIYPNYHVRNEISDLWNAHILGGMDLKWVGPSMDELIGETNLARKLGRPKGLKTYTSRTGEQFVPGALRDEAESMGVVQSAQWQNDVDTNVLGALAPGRKGFAQAAADAGAGETGVQRATSKVGAVAHEAQRSLTDNKAIAAAAAIGNMREQAFRLALYMDRRMAGWGPEASAQWVRKHLIDYGQLSNFESQGIKRVLPFYTFTRHNAPLQLEYLFAKPGAFGAVGKARANAGGEEGLGVGDTPLPSFLEQGVPLRTGTSESGDPEFWRLEGMWPGSDAMLPLSPVLNPDKAVQKTMSMVSPFIQEPIEQGTNIDWFRSMPGKPVQIEDYPGEEDAFLGVSMPQRWSHVAENLRPLGELNRLNPFNMFGTTEKPSAFGAVRKYAEMDPNQRWLNLMVGRGYAINTAQNRAQFERAFDHLRRVLEQEIAMAERDGKTKKALQAQRQLEYLMEHPESVTPDMAK